MLAFNVAILAILSSFAVLPITEIQTSDPLQVTDIRIFEFDKDGMNDFHFDSSLLSPSDIKKGTEIVINGLVNNQNYTGEHFDYITQIIDGNGVTVYLHVRPVAVPIGGQLGIDAERSQPLISDETGDYTIKIFTWQNAVDEPVALSAGAEKAIMITDQD